MIPPVEREGTLTTKDGRTLAYVERGSAGGRAGDRLARHSGEPSGPSSRPRDLRASRNARGGLRPAGLRALGPQAGRSVADAAADIEAIADELGFERFVVVGGSGGAPHALACGALLGDRIIRVGALVTPAPSDSKDFDFFDGLAELNVKEFGAALEGKEAIDAYIEPYVEGIRADPDGVLDEIATELPEVDRAIMNRKEYRDVMKDQFVEAVRQGVRGWADDDLAFAKPWGFEPEDVHAEVRLWQGELDVLAPRSHGEYVASRLPNARFELLEGGGHFLDEEWAVVYDWLTAGATEAGATSAGL